MCMDREKVFLPKSLNKLKLKINTSLLILFCKMLKYYSHTFTYSIIAKSLVYCYESMNANLHLLSLDCKAFRCKKIFCVLQ